jgi:hypothetical protein
VKVCIICTLAIFAILNRPGVSSAGSVSISQVANNIPNLVTNDIKVTADPAVSIGAMQVLLRLTQGIIYEHAAQSPLGAPPNPALLPAFPDLAYDSYVSDPVFGPSMDLGGPGGSAPVMNATTYDVSFAPPLGQNNAGAQSYQAARFTMSNNALGTFRFKVHFSDDTVAGFGFDQFAELRVVNGAIVPEPIALQLVVFAIVSFLAVHRQRKRAFKPLLEYA